jgi:hypothetical protein
MKPMNTAITVSIERSGQRSSTIHGGLSMQQAEERIKKAFKQRKPARAFTRDNHNIGLVWRGYDGKWNWFFDTEA